MIMDTSYKKKQYSILFVHHESFESKICLPQKFVIQTIRDEHESPSNEILIKIFRIL